MSANPNLAGVTVIPFAASVSEVSALEMKTQGVGNLVEIKVESLDESVDIVTKLQDSGDGSSWADVTSIGGTVKPGGAIVLASSCRQYFRIRVSGGYGRVILGLDQVAQETQNI